MDQLSPIVNEAIAEWTALGANPAQLSQVQFNVASLTGDALGEAGDNEVTLSVDAAGWGWYVDPTPAQNEEFAVMAADGLHAQAGSPAAGRMDLLTVVSHELGHELGLDHSSQPGDVMDPTLGTGLRRLPTTADMVKSNPS
jgi:hypothetical protein